MKITVVIPTMNEPAAADVVRGCLSALKTDEVKVLVVDRSTDDTAQQVKKAGATVIPQDGDGYGDAYLQGFRSIPKGMKAIAMLDGDGSYDPADLVALLKPIRDGEADMVIGNRYARMEKGAMSLRNRIGNRVITGFINNLYRLRLRDSQSGMRALSARALSMLKLESTGMPFASEMIIDVKKNDLRMLEVPVSYRKRIGEPKLNAYKDGRLILGLIIRLVRDYNPLTLFLPVGLILMLVGFVLGLSVFWDWVTTGIITRLASTMLSALLLLGGLQIIFFGLMADIMVRALRRR